MTKTVDVGNVGASYTNHVSVTGKDDDNDPATASAQATVTYTNVAPTIKVVKTDASATV